MNPLEQVIELSKEIDRRRAELSAMERQLGNLIRPEDRSPAAAQNGSRQPRVGSAEANILLILKADVSRAFSANDLIEKIGGTPSTVKSAASRLVTAGKIEHVRGPNGG